MIIGMLDNIRQLMIIGMLDNIWQLMIWWDMDIPERFYL